MKRNLLNLTLAGLPELEHFPTPEERHAALREIAREAGQPGRGSFWVGVLVVAAAAAAGRFVAGWLLSQVSWPTELEDLLKIATMLLAFFLVLRWSHRGSGAVQLRQKLLAGGVPVCMGCGYLLRGLPASGRPCPECGREFDEEVRRILGREPTLGNNP